MTQDFLPTEPFLKVLLQTSQQKIFYLLGNGFLFREVDFVIENEICLFKRTAAVLNIPMQAAEKSLMHHYSDRPDVMLERDNSTRKQFRSKIAVVRGFIDVLSK